MNEQQRAEKEAYLQEMKQTRGYILDFHAIMAEEDFEFLKRYNALLQASYLSPDSSFDGKTRELALIAILVSVRSTDDHIRTHMQLAKKLGAGKREVLEILEMCLLPAGLPAFMRGFAIWREVFEI